MRKIFLVCISLIVFVPNFDLNAKTDVPEVNIHNTDAQQITTDNRSEASSSGSAIDSCVKANDFEAAFKLQEEEMAVQSRKKKTDLDREVERKKTELESAYNFKAKDERIHNQWLILGHVGGAVILILAISLLIRWRFKTVRRNNRAMARNLDELLTYKNKMLQLEHEKFANYKLDGEIYKYASNQHESEPETLDSEDADNGESTDTQEEDLTDIDRIMLEKFVNEIIDGKLFTDPDFNRDKVLDSLRISKRTFTKKFELYSGNTYKEFITNLRLEHAAELIRKHPEYTIEGIAAECGITSYVTFHRNFTRHFGISPSAYRNQ